MITSAIHHIGMQRLNQCLKIDLKVAQTQLPGYYILYIVTEKTLGSLSRIVSSVRFKTGSQKEIQAIALNKTGTQCIYQCFPPELAGAGGGARGGGRAYSGDYTAKTVTLPSRI